MIKGKLLVAAFLVLLAAIATTAALYQPHPPAAGEIAMNKQVELFGSARFFTRSEVDALPPAQRDALIDMLNYGLRIQDSLAVSSIRQTAAALSLNHREAAMRARLLQILGRKASPVVDSFYNLVHQPVTPDADNSKAAEREALLERFQREVLE